MKLQVSINKKIGVINITSNSFILEDLKAHVCKKMKLKESDFKMKFDFRNLSIELVEIEEIEYKLPLEKQESLQLIKKELREFWKNLPMDCDANVMSIGDIELDTRQLQERGLYKKYRRVIQKREEYMPYYIAMRRDSAKVYLLQWKTIKGDFYTHFLFDMKSEQSVKAFFNQL